MAQKVTIDADECIGCQSCLEICPEVFSFNSDTEKAEVREEYTGSEVCIEEAVGSCPVNCITVD